MSSKLRKSLIKITGYWIYKKKHLTTGVDFLIDIENHYPKHFKSIKTAFDIGANKGQTAKKFSEDLKNCKIFSVEPEKKTFDILSTNTRNLKNVSTLNIGIGDQNNVLELHHGKHSEWNSFVDGLNDTGKSSSVQVRKLDDLVLELNIDRIDILKTDTEGYDINVLKGAQNLLKTGKIKFIYIEAGFYPSNGRNTKLFEVMELLLPYDFVLFGMYEVGKGGTEMVNGNALFVHSSVK